MGSHRVEYNWRDLARTHGYLQQKVLMPCLRNMLPAPINPGLSVSLEHFAWWIICTAVRPYAQHSPSLACSEGLLLMSLVLRTGSAYKLAKWALVRKWQNWIFKCYIIPPSPVGRVLSYQWWEETDIKDWAECCLKKNFHVLVELSFLAQNFWTTQLT